MHCTPFTSCLFLRLQPLSVRIGLWARLTFQTQLEGYVVRNEIPEYDASHVRFRLMLCSHLWDAESENEILTPRLSYSWCLWNTARKRQFLQTCRPGYREKQQPYETHLVQHLQLEHVYVSTGITDNGSL